MATTTPRIGLTKPDGTDLVDIAVLNTNFDKIDSNIASTKIQSTKPTTANAGDLWWDSDTGTLYLYYTDANSSQWVAATSDPINIGVVANQTERDAQYPTPAQGMSVYRTDLGVTQRYYGLFNSSTNPGGRDTAGWYNTEKSAAIVPVVPTSVGISGGSVAVSAMGEVNFSGTSLLDLNNIFTSAYRNYKIVISGIQPAAGTPVIYMRFLNSAGAEDSSAVHYFTKLGMYGVTTVSENAENATVIKIHDGIQTGAYHAMNIEVRNPQIAINTTFQNHYSGYGSGNRNGYIGGFFNALTQHYGIRIYASTGTQITGYVTVYGYNN